MSLFDKRIAFKPFEYPEITKYKDAINHSYWLVSEWNFTSDTQDFHVHLTPIERNAVKNAMLAISQIEISVKRFWTNLGNKIPKAEFEQIGVTFGESEVRHADAYSHLLEVLGLNDDFSQLMLVPEIQGRIEYLTKYLANASDSSHEKYTLSLTLFSLFIENVSLFSQFLIIKSFNKYKNQLKNIDNVVQATQVEENLHAQFGIYLVKLIKEEYPEWISPEFYDKIYRACKKAYLAEEKIIDWIFEAGELDFLSKDSVKEFIKDRFNKSVIEIGGEKVFEIDYKLIEDLTWFDEELYTEMSQDFFNKRPTTYSKKTQACTAEDLF